MKLLKYSDCTAKEFEEVISMEDKDVKDIPNEILYTLVTLYSDLIGIVKLDQVEYKFKNFVLEAKQRNLFN